jgi:hypothetical protein
MHRERSLGVTVKVGSALLPRRHCERSEAIQNPSAESLWIASLRSK